jgi:hypothetical protein
MTSSTTLQNDAVTTEGAADGLLTDEFDGSDFVAYFDMLSMNDLVVIQVYLGDEDDTVLDQLRPRHVIMYEPDVAFVRRVEVSSFYFISNLGETLMSVNLIPSRAVLSPQTSRIECETLLPHV